jgi:phosphatidylinositol-3-phosphatase
VRFSSYAPESTLVGRLLLSGLIVLFFGLGADCNGGSGSPPPAPAWGPPLTTTTPPAPNTAMAAGTDGSATVETNLPLYEHIFVIVEENHGYGQVIGNRSAPTFNRLAQSFGLATGYFGVGHPSEPNYVALLGGDTFGIHDDGSYSSHSIDQPGLVDQLEEAGLEWKGYFQSLQSPGFTGACAPSSANCRYVSRHNGFLNFRGVRDSTDRLLRLVPDTQLAADLQGDRPPSFGLIVPDLCHDMHGMGTCTSPAGGTCNDDCLVAAADTYAGGLVDEIIAAPFWQYGNNAVVIVWDEDDFSSADHGCCDASPGGGHVPAIVITSRGPRGLQDGTPANHYSLLQTVQQAFGLGCLQFTCDTAQVTPLAALFGGR